MEDGQADYSSDEFEVVQMLRVDARVRIDLQGIVVVSRVLKKAVERIKHFMRQQEKKLSASDQCRSWIDHMVSGSP